jgi:hypothetical protein
MGSAMETIHTFFLNYEQYIILLTICFFAGMAWRHHRLISRLFIIAASCLWVIYVYRYQIAVGWPALDALGGRVRDHLQTDVTAGVRASAVKVPNRRRLRRLSLAVRNFA